MTVTVDRADRVAIVTLDRPAALNALDRATASELIEVAASVRDDPHVRAVVITGAGGRAFCAGADIAEMGRFGAPDDFRAFIAHLGRAVEAFAALPQPTVAAVEGVALGGGFELALSCDLRVVGTTARLGLPEIKLGLLPGLGGTQRAIRLLPPAVATRLLLLGGMLDAAEAFRCGLTEAPVEAGQALTTALEVAQQLAAGPPLAMAAAKRLIAEGSELPLAAAIELEQRLVGDLFATADAAEGVQAFLEKRSPRFEGR